MWQKQRRTLGKEVVGWLVGWLVVFNVPSTARSFRDGTPIYCPLRRTWSSINTPFRPGFEPRAVAWQSITLPLRYASSTGNEAVQEISTILRPWKNVLMTQNISNWCYNLMYLMVLDIYNCSILFYTWRKNVLIFGINRHFVSGLIPLKH